MIHLLSHVTGSEVNDSRPVGSGHQALIGPSDCARDSDWIISLIPIPIPIFVIFLFLFLFFYCFCIFSFWLGLDGNPLLIRCPITQMVQISLGWSTLVVGSALMHTLKATSE